MVEMNILEVEAGDRYFDVPVYLKLLTGTGSTRPRPDTPFREFLRETDSDHLDRYFGTWMGEGINSIKHYS